jgi:DNA-binding FadR family transcriptional regulator
MTVDPTGDRPVYKQLADLIRAQIQQGELRPGQRIPAEHDYAQEQHISRDSVRKAMAILRNEGLIIVARRGSHVRSRADLTATNIDQGRIFTRMPTEPERRQLQIGEGVPIFVIEQDDQEDTILPGDRTFIVIKKD